MDTAPNTGIVKFAPQVSPWNALVGLESATFLVPDLAERITDPQALSVLFDSARALESMPELLGFRPHLLAAAVRPV